MMSPLKKVEAEVASWPYVTDHAHRFGGREFRFGRAEIGHVHTGGTVDIPFPRAIHDALLADGLAKEHRWVPNSGWITFEARSEEECRHAVWLMRLSYLRYALKNEKDAQHVFECESLALRLSPKLKALLEPFILKPAETDPIHDYFAAVGGTGEAD